MAQALMARGADVRLLYAVRSADELVYADTLQALLGDRLQSFGNPLAQAMELRQGGQLLPLAPAPLKAQLGATASPHLLLLIHGLSMNDTQWSRSGHDHGEFLAQALAFQKLSTQPWPLFTPDSNYPPTKASPARITAIRFGQMYLIGTRVPVGLPS
jgi:hypothetical protein